MEIKFISAVIMVHDIPASRYFYEEILAQKVAMDHGPNVGYVGGLAIWQKEHANQVIFHRSEPVPEPGDDHPMEIYFESEELEEVHQKLVDNQVEFVHDLMEQPWSQRVLRVYDPDRTIVEVGEPMSAVIIRHLKAGASIDEIVQRTFMPREIIEQIANTVKA